MAREDNTSWTNDEAIQNANTIVGDIAILNRLKKLSEFLLSETVATSSNVDKLLNQLDTVGLKLDLTKNDFQSLRNTQFVENRVYEDDEIAESGINNTDHEKNVKETEDDIKDAILEGLNTLNKYFEKVEVAVSDSEDEETEKSYVLQPKDMYAERPLPYLIGTDLWNKNWHVGLSQESESESEKEEERFSDGLSEDDLPKDRWPEATTPVAHSTFNDSPGTQNISDSPEDVIKHESPSSTKDHMPNDVFAEQLAAKLGSITNNTMNSNINTNPIMPPKQTGIYGNLFSEEPPPLNDNDSILPKTVSSDKNINSQNQSPFNKQDYQNNNLISQDKPVDSNEQTKRRKLILFDERSSSEEDISAIVDKRKVNSVKPYLENQRVAMPLMEDQPPEILQPSEEPIKKTKPVGGISIFGQNSNIFAQSASNIAKTLKKSSLFDESSDEEFNTNKTPLSTPVRKDSVPKKKISLFDDDIEDDDFVLPPKVSNSLSTKKSSLFDDDSLVSSGMFSSENSQKSENDSPKKYVKEYILFEDDDNDEEGDILFGGGSLITTPESPVVELGADKSPDPLKQHTHNKTITVTQNKANKVSLFDDSDNSDSSNDLNEKTNINNIETQAKEKEPDLVSDIINENYKEKESSTLFRDLKTYPFKEESDIKEENVIQDIMNDVQGANLEENVSKVQKNITLFDSDDSDDGIFNAKSNKSDQREKYIFDTPDKKHTFDNTATSVHAPINKDNKTKHLDEEKSDESTANRFGETDRRLEITASVDKPPNTVLSPEENIFESKINKYATPPAISLFDSTPPPDIEWDNRSENSADSDTFSINEAVLDYMNSNVSQQRSNLFDEPPSLDIDVNYSSGIVKDLNVTRVDTDDSSFHPYASSSRRLSSDVFNEQQSQDSFFITKSNTESTHQVSSLGPILENSENNVSSKLDYLTPSGTARDFDSSSELEKSDNNSISARDMSGRKAKLLMGFNDKESSETNDVNKFDSNSETSVFTAKTSPGKLKHNLNINVAALKPGAARPQIIHKTTPTDETDKTVEINVSNSEKQPNFDISDTSAVLTSVTKNRARIPVKRRPSSRRARQESVRKSMNEFDSFVLPNELIENSNLLNNSEEKIAPCIDSENVTPTLKHSEYSSKSTTHKALNIRDELSNILINSSNTEVIQEKSLHNIETVSAKEPTIEPEISKPNPIYNSAPTTEDIHVNLKEQPIKNDENLPEASNSTTKASKHRIFDKEDSSSDDDFFSTVSKNIKTSVLPRTKKPSLFSDQSGSDTDNELFSSKSKFAESKKSNAATAQKLSLFDDCQSDDDDLFGPTVRKIPENAEKADKKVSIPGRSHTGKTAHIRKLENKEVTDFDPLSRFK